MSKSGLFAHFGSKQELQLATVAAAAERFRTAVIEPALQAPDGVPRLEAMAGSYLAHLERNQYAGGCFWAATSAEYDDRPGPVRDAIASALDAWLGELERQAGIAGSSDPGRFAFELYAVVMGANSRYRLSGDRAVFGYARDAIELPARRAAQLVRSVEQADLAQDRDRVRVDVLALDQPVLEGDHVDAVPAHGPAARRRLDLAAAQRVRWVAVAVHSCVTTPSRT